MWRNRLWTGWRAVAMLVLPVSCAASAQALAAWTPTWGAAMTAPYGTETLPDGALSNATLRQIIHLSAGGSHIALRITNAFGTTPLEFKDIHVALRSVDGAVGAIDAASDHAVLFGGERAVTVPAGAEYVSDPVTMPVKALSDLVVTMETAATPATPTVHAGARATSFLVSGTHAADAGLSAPQTFVRWYFLDGVLVSGPGAATRSVVALGDSITDGHGATTDGNDRWTDVLAARLNGASNGMGVVNEGIGGNRVLLDGIGPSAAARFDRDVLANPAVTNLLVLEGINDLGLLDRTEAHPQAVHDALVLSLETAFHAMVNEAHQHGIHVLGATLTPFVGFGYYHPGPASEADRVKLNDWIRHSGAFDAVVDFDSVLRDPAHPAQLLPAYDSGDHLHPNPKGYARMGQAVPLAALQ